MTRRSLAYMYYDFSDGTKPKESSVIKHLMRMIYGTSGLLDALKSTGYKPYNRYFTPKQVEIIFQFLGEP